MGLALVRLGTAKRVFNGLRLRGYFGTVPRKLKQSVPAEWITPLHIERWRESTARFAIEANEYVQRNVEASLGMFHDVQTSVSSILRNAEEFVSRQPGRTAEDRFEALPATAKAMIKSVELLEARLALMPLVSNPLAAKFGKKHSIPVYRSIDRLIRILRSTAQRRRIDIRLSGTSRNAPWGYDSFDTVPLVILENAVKYSKEDSTVNVEVMDIGKTVRVRVTSYSPHIPADERARIFERGFRGNASAKVASQGSGVGLYLARVVADAHGFQITVRCSDPEVGGETVPFCTNTFEFTVLESAPD
jgi:signal transduction histidine kinase